MNWYDRAPCRNEDPDLFFFDEHGNQPGSRPFRQNVAQMHKYCRDCTVRGQCLKASIYETNRHYGTFGGVPPHVRTTLMYGRRVDLRVE